MKLLVFAHVPPPYHGQSYMVKLMLDGFGGDRRRAGTDAPASPFSIECYHVNARYSTDLADIGEVRPGKISRLLWYCLKAIWCRFRHGAKVLYYVPAPGKTPALLRDWVVMLLCRPFFSRVILHWHAAGMVKWLETSEHSTLRKITRQCLGRADLCISLSAASAREIAKLNPKRVRVVANGIPDPCPEFDRDVLARRQARDAARQKLTSGGSLSAAEMAAAGRAPECLRVLYMAHCTREKGLFDCLEGVARAAERLKADHSPLRIELTVAGQFLNAAEEAEFKERIRRSDLLDKDGCSMVRYLGFVSGDEKRRAFLDADCFCFPTYYHAESFGIVVVEAMAFGLFIITTRWNSVPELLPEDYRGLVNPQAPGEIAERLLAMRGQDRGETVRQRFAERYRDDIHLARLAEAIHSVEEPPDAVVSATAPHTRLLVFAHTPPPHHGQSFMVSQILSGFGGDQRQSKAAPPSAHGIACYHVNARFSRQFEDIGAMQVRKLFVLFWYCLEAVWCAFRYRPGAFYYVPAPGKKAALWRDWMVMALCRPFYRQIILHWHAAGLGHWLNTEASRLTKAITQLTMGSPTLSVVISDFNRFDAEYLKSKHIARVDYGIPDPCPGFDNSLRAARAARARVFREALTFSPAPSTKAGETTFNVLFLANCLRTKGIFDALEAFLLVREQLGKQGCPLALCMQVGGAFGDAEDEREFKQRSQDSGAGNAIEYLGFVSGERKDQALSAADLLCFPTYYPGENQPLVLIEALAYGLPAVTTTWRGIPDMFPAQYPGLVHPKDINALTKALRQMMSFDRHEELREHFCQNYILSSHLRKLAAAIRNLE